MLSLTKLTFLRKGVEMFQISISTLANDYTGIKVYRNTESALKAEGVTSFEQLQEPGNSIRFDTLMNVKTGKEATEAFNVLNGYVKYRGDSFIEELYRAYEIISSLTQAYLIAPESQADAIRNKFVIQLGNIIRLLDIDEIHKYITTVKPIPIPPNLKANFNTALETDGLGTRDQTYIVEDYVWLMALIVIFKATYGPLAEFIHGNPDHLKEYKEIQMLDLLKQQAIYKHISFQKLKAYISAIVDRTFEKDKITDIRIISSRLSLEMIKEFYLSKGIFGKIITMNQMEDTEKFDIVKYLYKDVNSKIRNPGAGNDAIRSKNKPTESSTELEDKESVIESYRISTEIPPGMAVEFNWAVGSGEFIVKQLPKGIKDHLDPNDIKLGLEIASRFLPNEVTKTHMMLFGTIFKRILDCRGIDYLQLDNVKNMIGIGFAVLKSYGLLPLAYLLVSKRIAGNNGGSIDFSLNINSTKAKGYREDELEELYPFKHQEVKGKEVILGDLKVLDWVHAIYLEIFKYNWQPPVELKIGIRDMLVPTLRNCLIDFLIINERKVNGE